MTLRAAILKQQMDCINESFRHANSCHDLFVNSLKLDQLNYKLQSQRGGLRKTSLVCKVKLQLILVVFFLLASIFCSFRKVVQGRDPSSERA